MNQRIAHIALLVNNYDEAIQFYTQKLNSSAIVWYTGQAKRRRHTHNKAYYSNALRLATNQFNFSTF